jgi:hypothetical protein
MRFVTRAALLITITGFAITPLFAQQNNYGGLHFSSPAPRVPPPRVVPPIEGGRPYPVHTFGPPPLGLRAPAAGYTGIDPGALKSYSHYDRRNNQRLQPGYFAPYYYPFLGYSDSGYETYPPYYDAQDPEAQSQAVMENLLGQQIKDLSSQIDQLRNDQQVARNQPTAPYPVAPAPAEEVQGTAGPPIKLVLRSGQQIQVQDYAVVNGMFWDFTNQPVRRIPIAGIDSPASQKATEESGAEFPQLGQPN